MKFISNADQPCHDKIKVSILDVAVNILFSSVVMKMSVLKVTYWATLAQLCFSVLKQMDTNHDVRPFSLLLNDTVTLKYRNE
jgi:hypothetical protein